MSVNQFHLQTIPGHNHCEAAENTPVNEAYITACEKRRKSVEKALAIILTATNGPDETFMRVLDSYIWGKLSLEEMETRIDQLEYLGV